MTSTPTVSQTPNPASFSPKSADIFAPKALLTRPNSSLDPNLQKNRVPTETELKGLRSLMKANSSISESLKEEIERLQTSHTTLSERYREQQREIEATQSQMFEIQDHIEFLQRQRLELQQKMTRMAALIHPIRRLPSELLEHIFQCVVGMSESQVKAAFALSSVCQAWRRVALNSPRLWHIICARSDSDAKEFWEWTISLIRSAPAEVHIKVLEEDHLSEIASWSLSNLPNLHKLSLTMTYDAKAHVVCNTILGGSYRPLVDLSIVMASDDWVNSDDDSDVDYARLIEILPCLTTLRMEGKTGLRLQPAHSDVLQTLVLKSMDNVDIFYILRHFPRLETLELLDVEVTGASTQEDITLPSMRRLKAYGSPIFDEPWALHLKLPQLYSLSYDLLSQDIYSVFVGSHPSIKELECIAGGNSLAKYANKAPQITYLSLSAALPLDIIVNWRDAGLSEPPFPLLQVLGLGDTSNCSPSEFEAVVRARCLPMNHPSSQLEHPSLLLDQLQMEVPAEGWEDEPWAQHELFHQAIKAVVPFELDGHVCVVLRWH